MIYLCNGLLLGCPYNHLEYHIVIVADVTAHTVVAVSKVIAAVEAVALPWSITAAVGMVAGTMIADIKAIRMRKRMKTQDDAILEPFYVGANKDQKIEAQAVKVFNDERWSNIEKVSIVKYLYKDTNKIPYWIRQTMRSLESVEKFNEEMKRKDDMKAYHREMKRIDLQFELRNMEDMLAARWARIEPVEQDGILFFLICQLCENLERYMIVSDYYYFDT